MPNPEELLVASWRLYPALALAALGLWLCGRGLFRSWSVPRTLPDPHRALRVARGLRLAILGAGLVGVGAGWLLSTSWVIVVSSIVIGEEMLETSTLVATLRHGAKHGPGPASSE